MQLVLGQFCLPEDGAWQRQIRGGGQVLLVLQVVGRRVVLRGPAIWRSLVILKFSLFSFNLFLQLCELPRFLGYHVLAALVVLGGASRLRGALHY